MDGTFKMAAVITIFAVLMLLAAMVWTCLVNGGRSKSRIEQDAEDEAQLQYLDSWKRVEKGWPPD